MVDVSKSLRSRFSKLSSDEVELFEPINRIIIVTGVQRAVENLLVSLVASSLDGFAFGAGEWNTPERIESSI